MSVNSMPVRFTQSQLKRLGYVSYCENFPDGVPCFMESDTSVTLFDSLGPYKELLDLYVGSFVDGSQPNFVTPDIPDSAPATVKEFFAAFTQQNIASLLSAPDDEVAFDTIIPRGCSYSQYRDYARSLIHKYSDQYKSKQRNSIE